MTAGLVWFESYQSRTESYQPGLYLGSPLLTKGNDACLQTNISCRYNRPTLNTIVCAECICAHLALHFAIFLSEPSLFDFVVWLKVPCCFILFIFFAVWLLTYSFLYCVETTAHAEMIYFGSCYLVMYFSIIKCRPFSNMQIRLLSDDD